MAETDPVKYFKSEIKRLNYYNSQFLKEEDFRDEQLYHNQMRYFHNRALHTWGIVQGLEVKPVAGTSKVTVAPGIAIDRLGREIVLPAETDAIGLDTFSASSQVYITIKYGEVFDQGDKDLQSTSKLYTRTTERPEVNQTQDDPAADAPEIVLAIVGLDKDKAIARIDTAVRRYAGSRIGLSADGKEFSLYADSAGVWHFADGAKGADRLSIDGNGNLNVTGGNIQLDTGREVFFKDNGQIRSSDNNHCILFRRTENKLEVREFGDIIFSPGANKGEETAKVVISSSGNVGIGTPTPGFPLSLPNSLGDKVALWGQSGNHYGFGIQNALLQIHTDTVGSDVAFGYGSSGSFTETMRVKGNGNVGIGRDPVGGAKLDVNGEVRALVLRIADGNGTVYPDNWIGIANNIEGTTNWLHVGGITDNGERRLGLIGSRIFMSGNVGIGTVPAVGRLNIAEATGTTHGPNAGTIVLDHDNSGGASSIVFRSKVNRGSDYGFIQYQDAETVGASGESARLVIGTSNDPDDHLILQPSGNVGIGTMTPAVKLSINGPGTNAYQTDLWIENNMHAQGYEKLAQGGRGRLRVGTTWYYVGIYADNSSTGAANDLILGASSGNVRIGPGSDSVQNLLVPNGTIKIGGDLYVPGASTNTRIVAGTVNASGQSFFGTGCSISKKGTGLYQIDFSPAFPNYPAASVTQIFPSVSDFGGGGDTRDNAVIVGLNQNSMKVKTGGSDGSAGDRSFTFVVVGPR
jgi:hypothetical protein